MIVNPRCIFPSRFWIEFCLRTSKSLSMGEFDKCHICMGILNDLDSFLGLICIIYCFMHIFLRLRSVLACSGFHYRFPCVEPSIGRKVWCLSQAKSRELARQAQQAQVGSPKAKTRELQRSTKRSGREALEPQWPEATTGYPWWGWHGRVE